MPLYTYRCSQCGQSHEQHNTIANRANGPTCCGAQTVKQLDAPMVSVPGGIDIDYKCAVTGQVVQSMRQRRYIMEKNGLVDAREVHDAARKKMAADIRERDEVQAANAALPDAVKKAASATVPPVGA